MPHTHLSCCADYSSLQPPAYTITLSFNISGTEYNPLPVGDLTNPAFLPKARELNLHNAG